MGLQDKLQNFRDDKLNAEKEAGATFMAANKSKEGVTELPNGIQYQVLKEGSGAKPSLHNKVKAHYRGSLLDGKEFDSSVGKQPIELPIGVGQVIPGWDDAIMKLHKGEKATLIIPSTMAYGAQGSPPVIPANAVLLFDVSLLDVRKNPQPQGQMPQMPPQGR